MQAVWLTYISNWRLGNIVKVHDDQIPWIIYQKIGTLSIVGFESETYLPRGPSSDSTEPDDAVKIQAEPPSPRPHLKSFPANQKPW
jgi:hypothetical protein